MLTYLQFNSSSCYEDVTDGLEQDNNLFCQVNTKKLHKVDYSGEKLKSLTDWFLKRSQLHTEHNMGGELGYLDPTEFEKIWIRIFYPEDGWSPLCLRNSNKVSSYLALQW